jgi:hypothetical protein
MEPVTVITTALGLAKSAGDITSKLNELYKNVKDREIKQQVAELLDQMQELKRSAYAIEDESRDLREKLRFKSDDFEFRPPFYYEKTKPQQALCPRCFHEGKAAPMGDDGQGCGSGYRLCLVCREYVQVDHRRPQGRGPSRPYGGSSEDWMG